MGKDAAGARDAGKRGSISMSGRTCAPARGIGSAVLRMLAAAAVVVAAALLPAGEGLAGFDFDNVAAIAERLAGSPFQEPKEQVPDMLQKISYSDWRSIRFRPDQALWRKRGLPFEVQFFHPGIIYNRIVRISTVDSERVHPVKFSPGQFDYGKHDFATRVPQDLGYAGFRIHYPLNRKDYKDEVIVFLGASYFRAVGADQVLGLSARGLAIDTGLPSGEEFPYFREFWLVTPARDARSVRVYALLDSPRATAAYNFRVTPGRQTAVDVEARIFPRGEIEKVGIAPLTSMFFFGENTLDPPVDYRPEVHDSDGLLVALETGEWIWRPLINPKRLSMRRFEATNPEGFGLLQRDRNFDHHQDLETRSELRPCAWVRPRGRWGKGSIELVEIPSPEEIHDNIVAYWIPGQPLQPGRAASFSYTLYWYADDPDRPPGGRVEATRHDGGTGDLPHRLVIDFAGKRLSELSADTVLRGVVTIGSGTGEEGELVSQQVMKNPVTGGWRLAFRVRTKTKGPIELRAYLARDGETLTETWTYVLHAGG